MWLDEILKHWNVGSHPKNICWICMEAMVPDLDSDPTSPIKVRFKSKLRKKSGRTASSPPVDQNQTHTPFGKETGHIRRLRPR
jgi:hypothetical protein